MEPSNLQPSTSCVFNNDSERTNFLTKGFKPLSGIIGSIFLKAESYFTNCTKALCLEQKFKQISLNTSPDKAQKELNDLTKTLRRCDSDTIAALQSKLANNANFQIALARIQQHPKNQKQKLDLQNLNTSNTQVSKSTNSSNEKKEATSARTIEEICNSIECDKKGRIVKQLITLSSYKDKGNDIKSSLEAFKNDVLKNDTNETFDYIQLYASISGNDGNLDVIKKLPQFTQIAIISLYFGNPGLDNNSPIDSFMTTLLNNSKINLDDCRKYGLMFKSIFPE